MPSLHFYILFVAGFCLSCYYSFNSSKAFALSYLWYCHRGNLNLMLLPTSDLRMSFIQDDGHTERLCTLSSSLQCSAAVIEEIPADKSGRSFLVKIPDHEVFYFWCSEKSMLLGIELLAKV